jgi:hypothetical protein
MIPRKPKTDQQRLPKKSRAKNPPVFQITDRDVGLVKAVCRYRYLTIEQITWLFPDSSQRGLENRLRYLFHGGYLNRELLHESTSHKLIYAMREKGARLIAERDGVPREEIPWQRHLNQITASHIRHLLGINDVVISLEIALAQAQAEGSIKDFRVFTGSPDQHKISVMLRNRDGARYTSAIVPDALVYLIFPRKKQIGVLFIEVDRATMSVNRWQGKTVVYREFVYSDNLREQFKANWSIVLTVTTSEKRLMSLAQRSVEMGVKRGFWYTTVGKVTPESILTPVWTRAGDLFQIRNEQIFQLTDIENCHLWSILDTQGD